MPEIWDIEANSVVDVPDAEVLDRLSSGRFALRDWDVDADGRVRVVAPDGGHGSVPLDSLGGALRSGYRLETHEDSVRAETKKWAARRGANPIEAGLMGFGDIASFGLAPQIATAAGDALGVGGAYEEYRDQLEQQNPGATLAGKVAGSLIPGSAVSGAGRAARSALAARGVGGLGQTVGGLAALGAAEGAVTGGAELVAEDALGRADILSQNILAYVGGGAVLGGALGAGLGIGGAALGKATRVVAKRSEEARRIRVDSLHEVEKNPDGVVEWLRSKGARAAAAVQGQDAAMVDRFLDPGRSGIILRQQAQKGAQQSFRDAATRELAEILDESAKQFSRISDESRGALKQANVAKVVSAENAAKGTRELVETLQGIQEDIDDIVANKDAYVGTVSLLYAKRASKYLGKMRGKLSEVMGRVTGGTADDAAEMFSAVDQIKRRIGEWSKPGGFLNSVDNEGIGRFRSSYERLRQHLERVDLYGDAALAQKAINKEWTELLETEKYFRRQFTERIGTHGWDPVFVAHRGRIAQFLNRLGGPETDLAREVLERHVRGQSRLSEAIRKSFSLDTGAAEAAARMQELSRRARVMLDDTYASIEAANNLADLRTGGVWGVNTGNAAKMLQMGPDRVYGLLGLDAVAKRVRRVDERVRRSVDSLIPEPGARRRSARGVSSTAVSVFFQTSLAPGAKRPRDRQEAFRVRSGEIVALMSDPDAMADRLTANIGELEQIAPRAAEQTAALSAKVVAHLYAKLPKKVGGGNTLTPLADDWRPSGAEIARFARHYGAAIDPLSVLEDLENGTLSREAVETLRELYPDLHAKIVARIAEKAGSRSQPLPYALRRQLSLLFGTPLDPSMRPERILLHQSALMSGQGQPVPSPGAPQQRRGGGAKWSRVKLSESMRTRTQRIGEHL